MLVVVDTETTGFGHMGKPPRPDGVAQIGLAWRNTTTGEVQTWEEVCNPGIGYLENDRAKEALEINGLNFERVLAARPIIQVARDANLILQTLDCKIIRSYNQAFDRPFLESGEWGFEKYAWGHCIMLQATRANERWPKLKSAAERYGIDTSGPLHSAGFDARLALLVAEALDKTQ